MENNTTSLFYLINLFLKHKKIYLLIFILASIAGVITAYLLPVKYKSESTFYPLSSQAYDPRYLFSNEAVSLYASSDDGDRIHGIAESNEIKWYIIGKYNLGQRYGLNKDDINFSHYVQDKFSSNFKVTETDFSALKISVMDANSDTAALIANEIVQIIDSLNKQPLLDISIPQLEKYQTDLEVTMKGQDSLYNQLLGSKSQVNMESITMEKMRSKYEYQGVVTRLSCLKKKFSSLNVIEKAYPSKKRATPVRWLVVLIFVLGSLFVYSSILITLDQSKGNIKSN